MILRIIDKKTKEFLRDDFHWNPETEISLTAPLSQCLYQPRWNGESWEEGATQEYIDSLKQQPQEPSLEERIQALETMELERILGGGF